MSGHHEKCSPQEVFLGNREREKGVGEYKDKGMKTIRLGGQAYDIYGKPLPDTFAPIFIHRSEEGAYNAVMMEKTFGPNWRRG